jgi:hypothetical protein
MQPVTDGRLTFPRGGPNVKAWSGTSLGTALYNQEHYRANALACPAEFVSNHSPQSGLQSFLLPVHEGA